MLVLLAACTGDPPKCNSCGPEDTAPDTSTDSTESADPDTGSVDSDSAPVPGWECDEIADGCTEERADLTLETTRSVDAFGYILMFAGDLDGGGRDDLLIWDDGNVDTLEAASAVIVLSESLVGGYNTDEDTTWAHQYGRSAFLPAGDVDADGRDDLLFECMLDGLPAAELITDATVSWDDRVLCSPDVTRAGRETELATYVWLGQMVADVDGDGFAEFPWEEVWGEHHLVSTDVFSTGAGLLDDSIEIDLEGGVLLGDVDGDGLADAGVYDYHGCCLSFYSGAGLSRGTVYTAGDADTALSLATDEEVLFSSRTAPDVNGDGVDELVVHSGIYHNDDSCRLAFLNPASAASIEDAFAVVQSENEHCVMDYWFPGDMDEDGAEEVAVTVADQSDIYVNGGFRIWAGGALAGTYTVDEGASFYLWGSGYGQLPGEGGPYGQGDIDGDGILDLVFGNGPAGKVQAIYGPLTE